MVLRPCMYASVDVQQDSTLSLIDKTTSKKSSARTPQLRLFATMSLCARGAISRALRLDSLQLGSKHCSRRLAYSIYTGCRVAPPMIKNSSLIDRSRKQCRNFSSSRPQRTQADIENLTDVLPTCCPGCGAFSQTIEPNEPGYYSAGRKQTRKLLASKKDAIEKGNTAENATSVNTEQSDNGEDAQPTVPLPLQG